MTKTIARREFRAGQPKDLQRIAIARRTTERNPAKGSRVNSPACSAVRTGQCRPLCTAYGASTTLFRSTPTPSSSTSTTSPGFSAEVVPGVPV